MAEDPSRNEPPVVIAFDCDDTLVAGSRILPGAPQAVEAVRDRGARVIVVSSGVPESRRALLLEGLGIADVDIFESYEKGLMLRYEKAAVFVGDHPADMDAAEKASAIPVGVGERAAFAVDVLIDDPRAVKLDSLEEFSGWLATNWHGVVDSARSLAVAEATLADELNAPSFPAPAGPTPPAQPPGREGPGAGAARG